MGQVESGTGFVEEQDWGSLGQGRSEKRSTIFPSAEAIARAIGEGEEVGGNQGLFPANGRLWARSPPKRFVARHEHKVPHRVGRRGWRELGQVSEFFPP